MVYYKNDIEINFEVIWGRGTSQKLDSYQKYLLRLQLIISQGNIGSFQFS